jgi:V/A-type H+-transporting ATPase subunit F
MGGAESVPVDERPKILILTEDVSAMIEDEVLAWQKGSQYPLIVEIPGIHGHLEGKKSLTDAIREAVGISV